MSNDRSRGDDEVSAGAPFEQWLERQAADEGISQEQLFERLVSSYWTLNEMEQLLGGSDTEPLSIGRPSGDGGASGPLVHSGVPVRMPRSCVRGAPTFSPYSVI